MVLVPEPTSPRLTPLKVREPAVNFLKQSTRPQAVQMRRNVNDWYERFPQSDAKFRKNLLSRKNHEHNGALNELYLHEQLRRMHEDVRYEEGGQGPDFRVYQADECILAIEVLSLFMRSDWQEEWDTVGGLVESLNKLLTSKGYYIDLPVVELQRSPSRRDLASFIDNFVNGLPHPSVPTGVLSWSLEDLYKDVYEKEGVRIEVCAHPVTPDDVGDERRVIVTGSPIGGWVNSAERLRARLGEKAPSNYALGDYPYVIAVGVNDSWLEIDGLLDALYGNEAVEIPTRRIRRVGNGYFGRDRVNPGGKNTRVSAVLAVMGFNAWEPERARLMVLDNPFAAIPLPDGLVPTTNRFRPVVDRNAIRMEWDAPLSPVPDQDYRSWEDGEEDATRSNELLPDGPDTT
jgi:hypothetical protein